MIRFNIRYEFSRNGSSWSQTSTFVNASSEEDAVEMVKNMYPYVRNIKILAKKSV